MARISGQSTSSSMLADLGRQVRAMRKLRGLSQEALAHEAGIDRSHMGKIERGERNVTLLNVERVAQALQVSLGDLMKFSRSVAVALDAQAIPRFGDDIASARASDVNRTKPVRARFDASDPRFVIIEFNVYPVLLSQYLQGNSYTEDLSSFAPALRDEFEGCLKFRQLAALANEKPGSREWSLGNLYKLRRVSIGNELALELGEVERRLDEYWF